MDDNKPGSSRPSSLLTFPSPKKKRPKTGQLSSSEKTVLVNVYKNVEETWPKDKYPYKTEIVQKTAEIVGVSTPTVYSVLKEYKTHGRVQSPPPPATKPSLVNALDEIELGGIRRKVHQFYFANEIPSINKMLDAVNSDESLPNFSRTSFFKVLKKLGFKYSKRNRKNSSSREQDPLSRVIEQCRFCGEFSKDCVAVSSDMTYLAGNKTTLALNDNSVQLDFNDRSLPTTVCRDCEAKLQEFCDFFKVVKAAQGTLINVAEEKEEFGIGAELEETTADFEERAEAETETLIVKTEYDSQQEDSDDDKEGIVGSLTVGETVFVRETHKRKSDTDTTKPKKLKTKEKCDDDDDLIVDIKEEVVEKDSNDVRGQSEVSDTGTDVTHSELELATSASEFEMAGDGTIEYQTD